MTKPLIGRLVLIEWEDSAQPAPGWSWVGTYPWDTVVKCQSVGWLVHDGTNVKAIAPNVGDVDEESAQVSGVIRIPARSITRIVELRKATASPSSRPDSRRKRQAS